MDLFVKIAKEGSEESMELPGENDGTILLSTVQAQFPSAIGLKYKSSSGGWRGIRAAENVLDSPSQGWGETVYYITQDEATLKRKSSAVSDGAPTAKSRKSAKGLLDDLIVFGLPYETTDEKLKEYFTETCGELLYHEVKYNRETKRSRGFGFIRFKTEEAAKKALRGEHNIMGRQLEIRQSKKKEENPLRLFVGRLPKGTTQEALKEYFEDFGELSDLYFPSPFRGFGFVTFASEIEGKKVLRMNNVFMGAQLNITLAEPKGEKPERNEQQSYNSPQSRSLPQLHHGSTSNYTWQDGESNRRSSYGQDRDRPQERYDSRSNQHGGREDRHDSQVQRGDHGGREDRHDSQVQRGDHGGREDRHDSRDQRGDIQNVYASRTNRATDEDRYDSHYKQRSENEDRYDPRSTQPGANDQQRHQHHQQQQQQGGGSDADLKNMLYAFAQNKQSGGGDADLKNMLYTFLSSQQ